MSRENWWLDFVEGELDSSTKAEMKSILKHSVADQSLVKSLSDTKSLLQEHAESVPDFSEDFFEEMHDKIMAQIEQTEIKKPSRFRLRPRQKKIAKTTSAGLALALVAVTLLGRLNHQGLKAKTDVTQQMAQHAQENPADLAFMADFQNEHDFLVDVATLSLDHLSKEQFESLLKKTKTR